MSHRDVVQDLLAQQGTTFAGEAGITLRDKPAPLYQLLVLATLASAPIRADAAVAAARELFGSAGRTPAKMRDATWQERVDALGRGGYRRYDESTATRLGKGAQLLLDDYAGDLRRIRPADHADVPSMRDALTGFPGIGPTGADIFHREVQAVWPAAGPFFDSRALEAADDLDLPTDPEELGALVPESRRPELAAALLRSR